MAADEIPAGAVFQRFQAVFVVPGVLAVLAGGVPLFQQSPAGAVAAILQQRPVAARAFDALGLVESGKQFSNPFGAVPEGSFGDRHSVDSAGKMPLAHPPLYAG